MDADVPTLFEGPGEMKARYRSHDWSRTALGPVEEWSPDLRLMVRVCLNSGFPMSLHWGEQLAVLYNDAFIPALGSEKHTRALGMPSAEVWPEQWDVIGELMRQVLTRKEPVARDDLPLILERNGFPEECYFTFSYNPVLDDHGTAVGFTNIVSETTRQVLSERRLRLMQNLGTVSATRAGSTIDTCRALLGVLAGTRQSVPFAAILLADEEGEQTRLVGSYGVDLGWSDGTVVPAGSIEAETIARVMRNGHPELLTDLRQRMNGSIAPGPIGPLIADEAMVLPLTVALGTRPIGVMVLGVNPYRPLDEEYRSFLILIGLQIGSALQDAKAYETERRQVQLLTDLDLVKMEFFQNVSHELRTPLTLMLAPLQDLLSPVDALDSGQREHVEAAVRAAQRLRRIVDALLDFAQAEAGSLSPQRQSVDLAKVTTETASMFRSATEHAGLHLDVEVPGPTMALVDVGMWSTIVTNLVANAVKFTASGGVTVRITASDSTVVLTVADTGMGIAPDEQSRVFDRFYRSPAGGALGGAGIGLALVSDLVHAHEGHVQVSSKPGQGTTFTVTVPRGAPIDELSPAPSMPEAEHSGSSAGETPDAAGETAGPVSAAVVADPPAEVPHLLLIEDDEDLRSYLTGLIANDGWRVTAVGDAESAAALIGETGTAAADLIVTDVMLPGSSGLELVAALRADPATARLPIIVLTARGGPEAATDGLIAGADDYIVKPFASNELLARVRSTYELNRVREAEVEQARARAGQLRTALDSNRTIGTATGILMTTYRLAATQAFQLLTRASQDNNRKLRDLAAQVVDDRKLPFRPTDVDHLLSRIKR